MSPPTTTPTSSTPHHDRSLLALILDVTPSAWGERDLKRTAVDKSRFAANKRSVGPARLDDALSSTLAFGLAYSSLHRENALVVIGVADDEVAVLYPRKGGGGNLGGTVHDPPDVGGKVDARRLHDCLKLGVAELVAAAAEKAERAAAAAAAAGGDENGSASAEGDGKVKVGQGEGSPSSASSAASSGAAIASGLTVALCVVNRFMVASSGGVSALAPSHGREVRRSDEGVLALIEGKSKGGSKSSRRRLEAEERAESRRARGMPSPRILVVQATDDRTRDYNAFMNCAFASSKADVVVDGCFMPSGIHGHARTSPYLEQACDRTGGVFLAPSGAAQVGGALTEVLMSVFLSPVSVRRRLNLPALTEVDFRARCFETGEPVDVAHVCNQCLSIFKNRPVGSCPTCGAVVEINQGQKGANEQRGAKRARH